LAPYSKPWATWVGRAALIKLQVRNYRLRLFFVPLLTLLGDNDSLLLIPYPRRNHFAPIIFNFQLDYSRLNKLCQLDDWLKSQSNQGL